MSAGYIGPQGYSINDERGYPCPKDGEILRGGSHGKCKRAGHRVGRSRPGLQGGAAMGQFSR